MKRNIETINDKAFVDALEENLKSLGVEAIIESRLNKEMFHLELKVHLRKGNYGINLEYAVGALLIADDFRPSAEIVARHLFRSFEGEREVVEGVKAYESLSSDAKAAFNIVCLQSYLSLEPREYKLVNELCTSGLVERLTVASDLGGQTLLAGSLAMRVNDAIKNGKRA